MNTGLIESIGLQLAASVVCGAVAYRLMRWFGEPIRGDEQAQAALEQMRELHQHAREQSRSLVQRELR